MGFQGQVVEAGAAGTRAQVWGRALWVVIALACVLFPAAAAAAPDETLVSSRSTGEGPPDGVGNSLQPGISRDGRIVVFSSEAPNLAPNDLNRREDVFVRDHGSFPPTTMLVSRKGDGVGGDDGLVPGDGLSRRASVSGNGRFVVFASRATNLVPNDSDLRPDIFVYDRQLLTTTVVSRTSGAGPPDAGADDDQTPSISDNGRFVAFVSGFDGLVEGDTNSATDIFVRDRDPDADGVFDEADATTKLVSGPRGSEPAQTNKGSSAPAISGDGRHVAFISNATNLVEGGTSVGLFVRNLQDNTIVRLGGFGQPSLSADGRFVASSGTGGIVVSDLRAATTTVVSQAADGTAANGDSRASSISADGRFVAFGSAASNLVTGDTNGKSDAFVRDLQEQKTTLASRSFDDAAGQANNDSVNIDDHGIAMAGDGRFVAFDSLASNLVPGDASFYNVFRRELAAPPAPPTVSISDTTVTEGNSGDSPDATFTLTLSKPSGQQVTVDYQTAPGTATAGDDYVTKTGTVTFAAGQTQQQVTVKVKGDTLDEANEQFQLNLSNPDRATLGNKSQGVATITDDDDAPALSVNDVSVTEGNAGGLDVDATFTVLLSKPSGQQVSVSYATADGTATAGSDYIAASGGPLLFAAGQTQKTVTVKVKGDNVVEADETFLLNLSGAQAATITDGQGIATILDNDVAQPELPRVSVNDITVAEGNSGTRSASFTLTREVATASAVTVAFQTANASAIAEGDYASKTGTATIAANQTTTTVPVEVAGDLLDEPDETFQLNLSNRNPSEATIVDGQGAATITDDDAPPAIGVVDTSVTEGDAGDVIASFTVSLSVPSGRDLSVGYATADGTATAPADYLARLLGTLGFAAGETSKTVSATVKGDLLDEPDEQFFLDLSSPQQATLARFRGAATIFDNDPTPAPASEPGTGTGGPAPAAPPQSSPSTSVAPAPAATSPPASVAFAPAATPPSTSAPTTPPASPQADPCVALSAGIGSGRLGQARLGLSRARHRSLFSGARLISRTGMDSWCITGGGKLKIGYPTARLLRSLSSAERRRVRGRAVLLLSSSRRHLVRGISRGTSASTLRRKLRGERSYRVGTNSWYLASVGGSQLAFRMSSGRVIELGLADQRLTGTRAAARRLLGTWRL